MDKYVTFNYAAGSNDYPALGLLPGNKEKIAAAKFCPEVSSFISQIKPDSKKLYILVNAMGAGEYYSSNLNADWFEEKELDPPSKTEEYGYRSFYSAGVYRDHKNKDKNISLGSIVLSIYNKDMHRVELIICVDREKAEKLGHKDLLDKLDACERVPVSMGTRVPFDVCNICQYKSKTLDDRCIHLKTMPNQILDDGRKVYVLNPKPKMFDISFVVIGADRTSFAMAKVASLLNGVTKEKQAAHIEPRDTLYALLKVAEDKKKLSTIDKHVPGIATKIAPSIMGQIEDSESDIPLGILKSLTRPGMEPGGAIRSIGSSILLKPLESQTIVIRCMGYPEQADDLYRNRSILASGCPFMSRGFDPISTSSSLLPSWLNTSRGFDESSLLSRLNCSPMPMSRVRIIAIGSLPNELGDFSSNIYSKYRLDLLKGVMDALLSNSDGSFKRAAMSKEASVALPLLAASIPLAYLYGAHVRDNRSTGANVGPLREFISSHPILASSILAGLVSLGTKMHKAGMFRQVMEAASRL